MSEPLDSILAQVVNLAALKLMQSAVIEEGPDGSPVLGGFPAPSAVRDYVVQRIDLSALGAALPLPGLTIGDILQLLTEGERTAAAAVIVSEPDLFAILFTALATGARLQPGDANFLQLLNALVAYDVITPERAGELLGG